MTEQTKRPWGEYKVIEKTKTLIVKPNQKLSLQYHHYRDEFWQILSGNGKVTINEDLFEAKPGDTFTISKGIKHRLESGPNGLEFLEIATGKIKEEDIIRIQDDYGRTNKKIIITSGYFDPIHIGHIEYLKLSKQIGGKLITILNNDKQAYLKKGKVFMPEIERLEILKAVKYIDEIFISIDNDKSVCKSIEQIVKDNLKKEIIFTKGGDRFNYEIPEKKICEKYNIQIIDKLGKKIQSSSNLTGFLKTRVLPQK